MSSMRLNILLPVAATLLAIGSLLLPYKEITFSPVAYDFSGNVDVSMKFGYEYIAAYILVAFMIVSLIFLIVTKKQMAQFAAVFFAGCGLITFLILRKLVTARRSEVYIKTEASLGMSIVGVMCVILLLFTILNLMKKKAELKRKDDPSVIDQTL